MSLEELGFGMILLAVMWRDGFASIPADFDYIAKLTASLTSPKEKIDAAWVRSHWPGITKLFSERPDGTYEPNPLMFSPPSDDPPDGTHH